MQNEDRPVVIMQMAASIDGRIALGPNLTMFDTHPASHLIPDGGSLWQKATDAIETQWHPQGTMMGSRTVEREGVPLRVLPPFTGDTRAFGEDFLPEEVVGRTEHWAIGVDGRGRCRSGYKATETPGSHILHLVSRTAPPDYLAFLRRERIPYLIGGETHADLPGAMKKLHGLLGLKAIRLWGGGTLNGVMLRAGLIDEIHLILQPALIGGDTTPTLADCPDLAGSDRPAILRLLSAQPQEDGHLWLHYRVIRP
ncbi:MAG: dihydrofolate reductase family protein [Armatimonadetes bacterium]|nr:dihydrofolate reductase family protein [Armatimonadota bacterium]